jgi:ornithine cyclodeaminase
MMPAALPAQSAMGVKVISVMPGNHGTPYDSHQGAVLLFETENGRLLAMIDASEITAIRTAAVSGVATKLLANATAGDLAILGSGVQAQSHLQAMHSVRPLRRVRIWSRNSANARAFVERQSKAIDLAIETMSSAQAAVEGADIICTTTASPDPVLLGEWIADGAHINAVGSSTPKTRELDDTAIIKASLFIDRRESIVNEAGVFLLPKAAGLIDDNHIRAELGEVLAGSATGRKSPQEITLFKSLGIGVEDLAAANYVYAQARQVGAGTWVEFGRMRDETS